MQALGKTMTAAPSSRSARQGNCITSSLKCAAKNPSQAKFNPFTTISSKLAFGLSVLNSRYLLPPISAAAESEHDGRRRVFDQPPAIKKAAQWRLWLHQQKISCAMIFYRCRITDDGFPAGAQFYAVQPLQNGNMASSHYSDSALESVSVCRFHPQPPSWSSKISLVWRTVRFWIFCASTRMPISIDVRPTWFTLARNVTSSPTWIGSLKLTLSTDNARYDITAWVTAGACIRYLIQQF